MTDRSHRLLVTILVCGTAAGTMMPACSPLPGASLDPLYLRPGSRPPATSGSPPVSTAPAPPPPPVAPGPRTWTGRYQDSRGSGEVSFALVRGETTVSGTWRLRTGGGGPVTAVAEGSGRRVRFRMENTTPECPGTFEGWAEITETAFVGSYQGKDCEGPISDGRLDLRAR